MTEPVELRVFTLKEIEKVFTFIRQNLKTLTEKADREAFKEILTHLETAKTMATDDRRTACLMDAAIKYANQLAFRLFVEDKLDEETLKIFRGFDTVKNISEEVAKYTEVDKKRTDEITRLQTEYLNERRPFEIFQAVIGGMSEEEAKKKQAEYLANTQQALHAQGA